LEQSVAAMDNGQLPLELLAFCRAQLQAVEQQVKVLDEGTLKAWEDA
jgi:exodeoxyribonuclease VII small subunit